MCVKMAKHLLANVTMEVSLLLCLLHCKSQEGSIPSDFMLL